MTINLMSQDEPSVLPVCPDNETLTDAEGQKPKPRRTK